MSLADRLAATEYAFVADPAFTRVTPFGRFVDHPQFRTRYDAHQLFDCRCSEQEVPALLEMLERLYRPSGLTFRKISTHCPATAQLLIRALSPLGWSVQRTDMMLFSDRPRRAIHPEVEIRPSAAADREAIYAPAANSSERTLFHVTQDLRLNSQLFIGYLDGQPAGTTGFFIHDEIARYRWVGTLERYRNRGVASTLIQFIQQHPCVRQAQHLTIFVTDEGPKRLYEELGFRSHARMWELVKHQ